MGLGDEIIGSAFGRDARAQGRRVAFGDGKKIIWGPHCQEIFANNQSIAPPGSEKDGDLLWIAHYKGKRLYNRLSDDRRRWIWNYNFKVKPGEFFFANEKQRVKIEIELGAPVVFIEPNVEWQKRVASNKDWGWKKYQAVAKILHNELGCSVFQFKHKNSRHQVADFPCSEIIPFRQAVAAMSFASLYIGPEGGMHHAAAALGIPAVVIFGGFIPPAVMGYVGHANLSGNGEACGNIEPCGHCRAALESITVNDVVEQTLRLLPDEM